MIASPTPCQQAPARLLAMLMAADGRVEPPELEALDEQHAYRQLGVTRAEFAALTRELAQSVGREMRSHNYLHLSDIEQIDALLDAVRDPEQRLRLCALAARVITADGQIRDIERMVFDHMLCRWGLTRSMVSRAILQSRRAAMT